MATDFFERQYQARKSTKWLIVAFFAGVIALVGSTMIVGWFAANGFDPERSLDPERLTNLALHPIEHRDDLQIPLVAGVVALMLIGGGSTFKIAQLSSGGHVVAESLGGQRVFPDTTDPIERRVLNVVEEMALASGVPVPPVFLLNDEESINAFAAGYTPGDAVIAVTRGCAEQLSRDELQGVVGHEFSHVLNGDMRLNIRLIGILNGILLLGLIGKILLRMTTNARRSQRSSKDGQGGVAYIALIGLALVILGFLGTLIGNLIKAAVSRQREYLADASAVQFTRNPEGLAGALKRIGGFLTGSRLTAANAAEASHLFFAQGVWEGFTSLTATHPPLAERIRRLDPQWNGKYPETPEVPAAIREVDEQVSGLVGGKAARVPVAVVARAADQVGDPTERHREYAAALLKSLPEQIATAAREPYGARAVLFGLLADPNPDVRGKQLALLQEMASPDIYDVTLKLLPTLDGLDVRTWLPLVDLTLPSLRAMSTPQYKEFIACFKALVDADRRLGLFEWTLHRILLRHLCPAFEHRAAPPPATEKLQAMSAQCSILLSTLAYADNRHAAAPLAVERGAACLPGLSIRLLSPEKCGIEPLSRALDDLALVVDKQRRHIVNACAACICADREVTVAEAELLRGICDMLDCPMPPLLPGGSTPKAADAA